MIKIFIMVFIALSLNVYSQTILKDMRNNEAREFYYSDFKIETYDAIAESKYLIDAANESLTWIKLANLSYEVDRQKNNQLLLSLANNIKKQNSVYVNCQGLINSGFVKDTFSNCTEKTTKVYKVINNLCKNNSRCGDFIGFYLTKKDESDNT